MARQFSVVQRRQPVPKARQEPSAEERAASGASISRRLAVMGEEINEKRSSGRTGRNDEALASIKSQVNAVGREVVALRTSHRVGVRWLTFLILAGGGALAIMELVD